MPRVKLNQSVNAGEYGGITTCRELLDSGKAIVERVDHFGRNSVTKYFVTLLNPDGTKSDSCFEIGQKAYESRVRKNQHILPNAPTPAKPVHSITFNRELLTLSIDRLDHRCTYDDEIDCFNVQIDSPSDSMLKELDRAMEVYQVESVNWLIGYTAGVYVDFNPKEE